MTMDYSYCVLVCVLVLDSHMELPFHNVSATTISPNERMHTAKMKMNANMYYTFYLYELLCTNESHRAHTHTRIKLQALVVVPQHILRIYAIQWGNRARLACRMKIISEPDNAPNPPDQKNHMKCTE